MPAEFKGGVSVHSNGGYLKITSGPLRDKLVHTVVAEGMLGRPLRDDEHVHHKDGDTKNPHWTNLLVVGRDVHNAVSNRQYWYLKQGYRREDAAWRAFFDVTGQTYQEWQDESFEPSYLERKADTTFEPANF